MLMFISPVGCHQVFNVGRDAVLLVAETPFANMSRANKKLKGVFIATILRKHNETMVEGLQGIRSKLGSRDRQNANTFLSISSFPVHSPHSEIKLAADIVFLQSARAQAFRRCSSDKIQLRRFSLASAENCFERYTVVRQVLRHWLVKELAHVWSLLYGDHMSVCCCYSWQLLRCHARRNCGDSVHHRGERGVLRMIHARLV